MNLYNIGLSFNYFASFSVVIPIYFHLKNKENYKEKVLNLLATILILGGLTDLIGYLISILCKLSNLPSANTEFILEFILISWLFVILCPPLKKAVILIAPLFLVLFVCTCVYWQKINTFQSITREIGALLILGYGGIYSRYLLKHLPKVPVFYDPHFWMLIAFFIYFSLNLFIYTFSSFVFEHLSKTTAVVFWMTHGFIEISRNIFLAIAFYYASHKPAAIPAGYYEKLAA